MNKQNRVPLFIPESEDIKAPKEEFISVNGKNYIVQKGVTVLVPPEVKEVWDNAQDAIKERNRYAEARKVREPGQNLF